MPEPLIVSVGRRDNNITAHPGRPARPSGRDSRRRDSLPIPFGYKLAIAEIPQRGEVGNREFAVSRTAHPMAA
jgi:hypothetical protein